jgi:hypothetical protein
LGNLQLILQLPSLDQAICRFLLGQCLCRSDLLIGEAVSSCGKIRVR